MEQRKANELPLNGRNVFNLIDWLPPVPQAVPPARLWGESFWLGQLSSKRLVGNQSAEYLDGQPLNIGYINLPVLIPTQDSIQEFRVQTSIWGRNGASSRRCD